MNDYSDIMDHPHYQSKTRPHMPMSSRAAQFSPFAALTGYDSCVTEAARLTDRRELLGEDVRERLDRCIAALAANTGLHPEITVRYFIPDERKEGGRYEVIAGSLKRIDSTGRVLVFTDGAEIGIDDIYEIGGEFFGNE